MYVCTLVGHAVVQCMYSYSNSQHYMKLEQLLTTAMCRLAMCRKISAKTIANKNFAYDINLMLVSVTNLHSVRRPVKIFSLSKTMHFCTTSQLIACEIETDPPDALHARAGFLAPHGDRLTELNLLFSTAREPHNPSLITGDFHWRQTRPKALSNRSHRIPLSAPDHWQNISPRTATRRQ